MDQISGFGSPTVYRQARKTRHSSASQRTSRIIRVTSHVKRAIRIACKATAGYGDLVLGRLGLSG
jgi:hypothetical protein